MCETPIHHSYPKNMYTISSRPSILINHHLYTKTVSLKMKKKMKKSKLADSHLHLHLKSTAALKHLIFKLAINVKHSLSSTIKYV